MPPDVLAPLQLSIEAGTAVLVMIAQLAVAFGAALLVAYLIELRYERNQASRQAERRNSECLRLSENNWAIKYESMLFAELLDDVGDCDELLKRFGASTPPIEPPVPGT